MAETILIITEDETLLDDLLRLCAAAGAEAEVAYSVPLSAADCGLSPHASVPYSAPAVVSVGGHYSAAAWARAPLVLVGDDRAARLCGVPRRPGVLLIGRDPRDPGVWEHAVGIGAEQVLSLPADEPRLAELIADAAEGTGSQGLTVGVLGGRGGAGASTLACGLALAAARRGERTLLVDADPLGGGLDVLMGGEAAEGLRWPALAESHGRVSGAALTQSLPRLYDVGVLSWDRGDGGRVSAEAMRSVVSAARRCADVVVVDLPRHLDVSGVEAVGQLDLGLLVVPAELRAVMAAHRVASAVATALRDLRVVVRGHGGPALADTEIARLLGLPLAGDMPTEHGLSTTVDGGRPPGVDGRGPLARFCTAFWAQALPSTTRPGPEGVRPTTSELETPPASSLTGRDVRAVTSTGQ